jgi:hypothetical protein
MNELVGNVCAETRPSFAGDRFQKGRCQSTQLKWPRLHRFGVGILWIGIGPAPAAPSRGGLSASEPSFRQAKTGRNVHPRETVGSELQRCNLIREPPAPYRAANFEREAFRNLIEHPGRRPICAMERGVC